MIDNMQGLMYQTHLSLAYLLRSYVPVIGRPIGDRYHEFIVRRIIGPAGLHPDRVAGASAAYLYWFALRSKLASLWGARPFYSLVDKKPKLAPSLFIFGKMGMVRARIPPFPSAFLPLHS